jgi:hypothetical protein
MNSCHQSPDPSKLERASSGVGEQGLKMTHSLYNCGATQWLTWGLSSALQFWLHLLCFSPGTSRMDLSRDLQEKKLASEAVWRRFSGTGATAVVHCHGIAIEPALLSGVSTFIGSPKTTFIRQVIIDRYNAHQSNPYPFCQMVKSPISLVQTRRKQIDS